MSIKTILLPCALCFLVACGLQKPTQAGAGAQAKPDQGYSFKTYDAKTFFTTTSYAAADSGGLAFTPDGARVLVSSDQTGVFNAYSLDVVGTPVKALTESDSNAIFGVSYFPNDQRLLYTFDDGGNELNHVYVREIDGTNADLTPGVKVKATFGGWSGDRQFFYLLTNERDGKHFDVYRYAASDYGRELIFENSDAWQPVEISRDGRWLALVKQRTSADSDIYVVDMTAESPTPKHISKHKGNIAYQVYSFTPDSHRLVFGTDEHGEFTQAWSYDLESGKKSLEFKDNWDVSFLTYSHTGKYRVTGVNADAVSRVAITDLKKNVALKLPAIPAGEIRNVRFSKNDDQVAFFVNGDTSPSNLFVFDINSQSVKQLTQALNPDINPEHLVESSVIRYKSFDGLEIPAILFKPKMAGATHKVPALVFVHGGPGGQTTKGYNAMFQHLVNHGYAVLGVNNRGSSGYGKTFFHMDDKQHGESDLKDVVWGRKYLESLQWVDGDKIGVIGGSYGGFMTAAALAFHPEAFDLGINIFGVTNWVRTLNSIPPWWEAFKESLYDEMGDPATDEERHRRISPLFHAKNIVRPMLVVQGANDPRVLKVESDELVAAIRSNDVPVEYVLFPDEGHGFLKRENRIKASEAYVRFLDQYLQATQHRAHPK